MGLDVPMPVVAKANVLIRAHREVVLLHQRFELFLQPIQPAFGGVGIWGSALLSNAPSFY